MTLDQRRLRAAREIFEHVAERLELRFSVRLWDGSMVPRGGDADVAACITIAAPGVLGSLLRRPTVERLLRHYAAGGIDFEGGDPLAFIERTRRNKSRIRGRRLGKAFLLRRALPLLFAFEEAGGRAPEHEYGGDATGRRHRPG